MTSSGEGDGANVEIANPIYMKDYDDDDDVADEFGLDTDKVSMAHAVF